MRPGHARHERTKIDIDHAVVGRVGIRFKDDPVLLAFLGLQEGLGDRVARKDRSGHPELGAHVRDRGTLRHRERCDALAAVLEHGSHVPLGGEHLEDRQDHVLGSHPGLELSAQVDLHHLRAGKVKGPAAHGYSHIQTACANSKHTDAASRGGVRIGAEQGLSRPAEALKMDLVANAVSGLGVMDAVFCRHGLEIAVVVGVLEPVLQGVMVHIAYGKLGCDPVHTHGLELEVGHGACGVLRQGLVDPDGDLVPRLQGPFHEVGFQDLFNKVLSHNTDSFPIVGVAVNAHYSASVRAMATGNLVTSAAILDNTRRFR